MLYYFKRYSYKRNILKNNNLEGQKIKHGRSEIRNYSVYNISEESRKVGKLSNQLIFIGIPLDIQDEK